MHSTPDHAFPANGLHNCPQDARMFAEMLRDPATIVLLEHAEFTRIDSVFTASALGWYCLGIVPQAGIEIHSRGFYALGDTRTPVALAVAAVVVNLVLSGLLWGRYGHEGLAFSVSAASWLEWAVLYRLYAQRTGASVAADLRAMAGWRTSCMWKKSARPYEGSVPASAGLPLERRGKCGPDIGIRHRPEVPVVLTGRHEVRIDDQDHDLVGLIAQPFDG